MITRRKFLTTAAASTAASTLHPSLSAQAANSEKPLFSVGLIADAQYAEIGRAHV